MRGKRTRRGAWIMRGALATLGLAGAVYAADQVTTQPPAASEDLSQEIAAQRVKQGELANQPDPEHQREKLTPDQMIVVAAKYDTESKVAYEHGESLRIQAYRQRDIIRMTCIDDKLALMKQVMNVVAPRLLRLPTLASNDLVMRQNFLVVQQARNRVLELASEIEECLGDTLDLAALGRIKEEVPTDPFDPTRPPSPTRDVDRPGEASPYR
jgi:hypothetical protein